MLTVPERNELGQQLQRAVKTYIGVSTRVQVQETGRVERTLTGKARRVVDKRGK